MSRPIDSTENPSLNPPAASPDCSLVVARPVEVGGYYKSLDTGNVFQVVRVAERCAHGLPVGFGVVRVGCFMELADGSGGGSRARVYTPNDGWDAGYEFVWRVEVFEGLEWVEGAGLASGNKIFEK